jgi:hypothetical protein
MPASVGIFPSDELARLPRPGRRLHASRLRPELLPGGGRRAPARRAEQKQLQSSRLHLKKAGASSRSAEANLKAMNGAVVLERNIERICGDRCAIQFGRSDATLHAVRVLNNDLVR